MPRQWKEAMTTQITEPIAIPQAHFVALLIAKMAIPLVETNHKLLSAMIQLQARLMYAEEVLTYQIVNLVA